MPINSLFFILFIIYVHVSFSSICFIKTVEGRLIDGSDNNAKYSVAGKSKQPYLREFPREPFYPNGVGKMLQTPIDSLPKGAGSIKCTDPLPQGAYPFPRCVINQFTYNLDPSNLERRLELRFKRSKRRTNHMATWFGHYISFDITGARNTIPSTPLYIPADDANYNNPSNSAPPAISFNLSETFVPDPNNSVRNGINPSTPFLDLNTVYGSTDVQLAELRDGTSCKLKLNEYRFPAKNAKGEYMWGAGSFRGWSLFTLAINTVWIREHNRLCDEKFKEHGNSWDEQKYFDEARKWNIAFYQKTVSEEYLGAIMGRPLPKYQGYKPELVPGLDTFFTAVTFRYGHTELSDEYRIRDESGDKLVDLRFDQIMNQSLLETFGLDNVLNSMALQSQEELDFFFSDATKNITTPEPITYDIPSFDIARARDRGIALYNTVREAYGLPRKNTWDEITSDKDIQNKLQLLYPNGPDTAEAFVGAFCEDHINGSNFGELLNASIVIQFNRIRETDRFWWESEIFNEDEKKILRDTTFRKIILRNLDNVDESNPNNTNGRLVKNIWAVQPISGSSSEDDNDGYQKIEFGTSYSVKYRLDNTHIYFKVELETAQGQGWFGMGFDPSDNGMKDAEFIIGIVENNGIELSNYRSTGGYYPPEKDSQEGLEIKSQSVSPSGLATIEFSRLLEPPNRKPIRREQMKYIMAYNPSSSTFSYHQNNRQIKTVNFYTNEISATNLKGVQKTMQLFHGIGMFSTWCLLFPLSVYIVRFRKHTDNYLKIHRNIQVIGGVSISTFGAAAIITVTERKTPHAWVGLIIYCVVFIQLGLGLASIWGQAAVVSVNQGYPRFAKRIHQVFGAFLLLFALINIYLGIDTFTKSYGYHSTFWKVTHVIWAVILITAFIVGETLWRRKEGEFNSNVEKKAGAGERKTLLHSYIDGKNYDQLPEFTWEEVNERVQFGAVLVVCDGLVVDIRKWIGIHPGGAKILERVVGTDITDDFNDTHKVTDIVEDVEPETRLISANKTNGGNTFLGKYDVSSEEKEEKEPSSNILKKYPTLATTVDNINTKYFSRKPLAIHKHSVFATKKMSSMVIGKMNEMNQMRKVSFESKETISGNSGNSDENDENIVAQEFIQRITFKRYKLTSKSAVSSSKKYPVIRFTFTKVYQDEKDVWNENFLPGHYIEVQSRVKGQIICRRYTPVEGKMSKSFSIYVKVYPNGLMSNHLNEILIGFEIRVRGPFDVSDRFGITNFATEAELQTAQKRRSSLIPPKFTTTAIISLLNPNSFDGCWEELFMICGGTGITPMLQLIRYHILHIRQSHEAGQRNRRINMYLLFGNRRIEDIIDGIRLEDYALISRGMFRVSFILSDPPEGWEGLRGKTTLAIIQKWFSELKVKTPTTPTTPTTPSTHTSRHSSDPFGRRYKNNGHGLRRYNLPVPQTIIDEYSMSPKQNFQAIVEEPTSSQTIVEEPSQINSPQSPQSTQSPSKQFHPLQNQQKKCEEILIPKNMNRSQSKIVVCGSTSMVTDVGQILFELGYSSDDYILLL